MPCTNHKVGSEVRILSAVVNDSVTCNVLRHRIGQLSYVVVLSEKDRVQIVVQSLVGRSKHSVITASREQLRDSRLASQAQYYLRADVSKVSVVFRFLKIGGNGATRESVEIRLVHLLVSKAETVNNNAKIRQHCDCIIFIIFSFVQLVIYYNIWYWYAHTRDHT